jgi:hypothetical protein
MRIPDPIQPKQPRRGFKNYRGNFLNIHLTAWTWPIVTSSVWSAEKPLCWQTFLWWWWGWNRGAEVAETTAKRLICCGFQCTGKVIGQVYQCWWRLCQEINVFFRVWIQYFLCFTSICHLCTDPPLYLSCAIFYV